VKQLTRDQVQAKKDKAVRFVRDVLGKPDRAGEIEDESLESYAERKEVELLDNPYFRRRRENMATKAELEATIQDLQDENDALCDQLDAISAIVSPDDTDMDDSDDGNGDDDDNGDDY
jgi:hypothetical protein